MKRRDFLKTGSKAAAALAGFTIIPSTVLGKSMGYVAPSDKVNVAGVGIGNRGGEILKALHGTGLANIVALCDADMGAPHTVDLMEKFSNAPRFQDFRRMFDRASGSFDAVCVGTPDFSHFPVTMLSMAMGKHVFVEKPMARTFYEVELMTEAAKRHNVVTQMGNQGHSQANYFQFKTWVEAGIIKDVTSVVAHMNGRRRWHGWDPAITRFPEGEPVPDTLDWDGWLSQAQIRDYHRDFINGQWRCWYDFGMGALGDWGAHIIDTVHRFLDLGLPYEVDPIRLDGHNNFFFPMATTLDFKFPARGNKPPMTITWYDGLNNFPELPEGHVGSELDPDIPPPSDGELQPTQLNPGKIIYSKDLTFQGGSHGSTLSIIPSEKHEEMLSSLPEVPESPSDHFENFLLGCKGEEECRSSFEIAGPLSQVFCLGVLAQRLGTKIVFDRDTKQIINNPTANELLFGPMPRRGWEEFYTL
ncbi:MAG: gfo/Idh/MocA family oxidoreductase [Balneolaceae bacterium]|nr:MAG: gfo/Idh/MocA family oxidoreductase [Balneolaceae bacterium]